MTTQTLLSTLASKLCLERTKEIYNNIADEFDLYRVKVWPCVARFLNQFNNNDMILDIGCGNGKNMLNHKNMKGIDLSNRLVEICKSKNLDVVEASMTMIPFDNDMFDAFIAVASYHHLDNDNDRMKTLNEMYRILK
jgi:alkylated DNA repair protein alkB family protein 8